MTFYACSAAVRSSEGYASDRSRDQGIKEVGSGVAARSAFVSSWPSLNLADPYCCSGNVLGLLSASMISEAALHRKLRRARKNNF